VERKLITGARTATTVLGSLCTELDSRSITVDFENQKMLETFFNERQTPKLLRRELLGSNTVIAAIQKSELPEDFCLDLLSHMILAKRAPITALVGLLKHHFESSFNPHQKTADMVLKAIMADLIDWDPATEQAIVRFDADGKTHELIRQYQYMPPMIVPPLTVGAPESMNRGSGYITIQTDSLILKKNHHTGDVCPDSLNRFNRIPLKLNIEIAKKVNNSWKNLDSPKADETFEDFQKRVKAFDRYQKDAAFTMSLIHEMGNKFYLTHKVDKRGRTYAQGYHINPQGNCWNKAVIELAEPEVVTT
jgi:hypothetical protein